MSYHADVMSAFSRRRFSTSARSSAYLLVRYAFAGVMEREETYRALLRSLLLRGFELLAQCAVGGDLFLEILVYY
jgi:hypothetical protein